MAYKMEYRLFIVPAATASDETEDMIALLNAPREERKCQWAIAHTVFAGEWIHYVLARENGYDD